MNINQRFGEHPYLKYSLVTYLLLAVTDTFHHFHAAVVLGQGDAMHAVWIAAVLIPITISLVAGFLYSGRKPLLWSFCLLVAVAILLPGFYHGGWHHLVKILKSVTTANPATNIKSLFPADDINLWFYEVTGLLELILACVCFYYLWKVMTKKV